MTKHAETQSKPKFGLSDFHSREKANAGRKMFLLLPDGTQTEEYLLVVNADSDVMAKAHAQFRDDAVANKQKGIPDPDFIEKATHKLVASAVIGWSLDEPFDRSKIEEFLRESPQNYEGVDRLIYDRKHFFGGAD